MELSFVDTTIMDTKCQTAEEFDKVISCAEAHPVTLEDGTTRKVLSNYDFSEVDFTKVKKRDFSGWIIKNVIFSKPSSEDGSKKLFSGFSFIGAKMMQVTFAQAQMVRCNFDTPDLNAILAYLDRTDKERKTKLGRYYNDCMAIPEGSRKEYIRTSMKEVDFFFTDFRQCRFRDVEIEAGDFRYSVMEDCTMRECEITYGDFYQCFFKGTTTFQKSNFVYCSITNAVFEQQCLRMNNIKQGILQTNVERYKEMVLEYPRWYRYNPCMNFSSMLHSPDEMKIYSEAKEVYRQLSGIFAGKGLNSDSNRAYRKYVDFDRRHNWYCLLDHWKKKEYKECWGNVTNIAGDILTMLCGYGYMGWVVIAWFAALVGLYTLLVYMKSKEEVNYLAYSLNNSLGPFEEYYKAVNGILPSLESVIGVLLVGFLGFVMANKIRNNS